MLRVGDKVRFLNSQGGGTVSRIMGKGMVAVTDEDGFDFPTPESECVKVDERQDNDVFSRMKKEDEKEKLEKQIAKKREALAQRGQRTDQAEIDDLLDELEEKQREAPRTQRDRFDQTQVPSPDLLQEEREGGNSLNVWLAFVPDDTKDLTETNQSLYFVNDSNYMLAYTIALPSGKDKVERLASGFCHPNTKEHIETYRAQKMHTLEDLRVQLIAFKQKRSYEPKPAIDLALHTNPVRYFKLHSYTDNDFFDQPALMLPVVKDDHKPVEAAIDPESIMKAIRQKGEGGSEAAKADGKKKKWTTVPKDGILEVDLHIDELVDTTAGMGAKDMLAYQMDKFVEVMNQYREMKGLKIIFIHGKGDGVLRKQILTELRHSYKECQWQDASFQEYGFGATQVTIR